MRKKLNFDKRHFSHYCNGNVFEDDSPTMVHIMFDKACTTTLSIINDLKNKMNPFNLKNHDDEPPLMLDDMKLTHNKILK